MARPFLLVDEMMHLRGLLGQETGVQPPLAQKDAASCLAEAAESWLICDRKLAQLAS